MEVAGRRRSGPAGRLARKRRCGEMGPCRVGKRHRPSFKKWAPLMPPHRVYCRVKVEKHGVYSSTPDTDSLEDVGHSSIAGGTCRHMTNMGGGSKIAVAGFHGLLKRLLFLEYCYVR